MSISRTKSVNGIVKIEEKIERIPKGWGLENSYNKIRYSYHINNCEVSVDFYMIGAFCEIEGQLEDIKKVARKLDFDSRNNIAEGIDEIFIKKMKKKNVNSPLC